MSEALPIFCQVMKRQTGRFSVADGQACTMCFVFVVAGTPSKERLDLKMQKLLSTALLILALATPVALFSLFLTRYGLGIPVAAAIAIVTGWALNVLWAFVVGKAPPAKPQKSNQNFLSIAIRFGWVCPTVLVFVVWLVWYFTIQAGS